MAEQTSILLSYTRFRALLRREGYRWKEPEHDLSHLQDRPVQETAAQVMEHLKNIPINPVAHTKFFIVDETTVSLRPPLRRCWMRRGERKLIPAGSVCVACWCYY